MIGHIANNMENYPGYNMEARRQRYRAYGATVSKTLGKSWQQRYARSLWTFSGGASNRMHHPSDMVGHQI